MTSDEKQKTRITLDDLPKLKKMLDEGVITQEEFDNAKARVWSEARFVSSYKKTIGPTAVSGPEALPEVAQRVGKTGIVAMLSSKNTLKAIGIVAICLILVGGYFYSDSGSYNLGNKNKSTAANVNTNSKGNTNATMPGTGSAPVAAGIEAKKFDTYGVITGDDVIMRSAPSTAGRQTGIFGKNKEVKILGKYVCDDESAAILTRGGITAVLSDGKHVNLEKGLALQILGRTANGGYRCKFTVSGKEVAIDFSEDEIRELYGEVWYHVDADGKTGYVFGSYVQVQ